MASDYEQADPAQAFAERRGITIPERVAELARKAPEKVRGMFDGLRLAIGGQERGAPPTPERQRATFADFRPAAIDHAKGARAERDQVCRLAVERHARVVADIWKMHDRGLPVLPHQRTELDKARSGLDQTNKHAAKDMEQAYSRDPTLATEAASGRTAQAIRAMQLEAEIRADPAMRAERFVESWRRLDGQRLAAFRAGDNPTMRAVRDSMGAMAKSLERDPQVESLLRARKADLGIGFDTGRQLANDLAANVGIETGRSLGLGR